MKRLFPLCFLLLTATLGFAQQPSEDSVKELLNLSVKKTYDATVDKMLSLPSAMAAQSGTSANPAASEHLQKMNAAMTKVIQEEMSWEKMEPDYVKIYQDTFTQEQIDGLIAFYKTPVGQAFLDKQPEVMEKSMKLAQSKMGPVMMKLQQALKESN